MAANNGKSFKVSLDSVNPAMHFISSPGKQTLTETVSMKNKLSESTGLKRNPLYMETKSRRVHLLIQPSLYEKVKVRAIANGTSVNEFVHTLLEEVLRES